jgi:hypothetical protein
MSSSTDYLTTMLREATEEIENLTNSITQVESLKSRSDSRTDALDNGVCEPIKNKLEKILEGRALEFEDPTLNYRNEWLVGTSYIVHDLVSVINLDSISAEATHYKCINSHTSSTDNQPGEGSQWMGYWDIATAGYLYSVLLGPTYGKIEYGITLTDWAIIDTTSLVPVYIYDGVGWDANTVIIQLVTDWNFACDYITHLLTADATYGTQPYSAALARGIAILTNNKNKLIASQTILPKYAT